MKKEIFFLILILAIRVSYAQSSEKFVPNSLNTDAEKENTLLCDLNAETVYFAQTNVFNSEDTVYNNESVLTLTDSDNDGKPCPGTATVTDYDGNTYNTVMIGNQCWMKENLRTTHYANGKSIPMGSTYSYRTPYSYYPNNNSSNVSTYGYLYNWKAAMGDAAPSFTNPSGVQGICPNGWHLPSRAEWIQLKEYVENKKDKFNNKKYACSNERNSSIAKSLAATTGWISDPQGWCNNPETNNATGFSALPAGFYQEEFGKSVDFGIKARFWSATSSSVESRNKFLSSLVVNDFSTFGANYGSYGFSVRCIRDFNNKNVQSCPGSPTVTDYDGNVYNTVKIGKQCWMKENLRTAHYSNGTPIPMGSSASITTAYRYCPDDNPSNVSTYGYLYNWIAVMGNSSSSNRYPSGVQGICPIGWHVPSDEEWTILGKYCIEYILCESYYNNPNANYIAKLLCTTSGWKTTDYPPYAAGYNQTTNNSTGFSVLPAGYFHYDGYYYGGFGMTAGFWSTSDRSVNQTYGNNAFFCDFNYSSPEMTVSNKNKGEGLSVRCVRD